MTSVYLNPGESIIKEVRNHWFIFLAEAGISTLAVLAPLVFIYLFLYITEARFSLLVFYAGLFVYLLWLVFVWTYFFLAWTDYYLDVWIITNKKIVDLKQNGLFHREISSFDLEKIQDVTIEMPGFISTMLKFGRLHIHTAVDGHYFSLNYANDPEGVKKIILQLAHQATTDSEIVKTETV